MNAATFGYMMLLAITFVIAAALVLGQMDYLAETIRTLNEPPS